MKDGYDFGGEFAQTYTKVCNCGNTIKISTQEDNYPEYYTNIFVKCTFCGQYVKFTLPVN